MRRPGARGGSNFSERSGRLPITCFKGRYRGLAGRTARPGRRAHASPDPESRCRGVVRGAGNARSAAKRGENLTSLRIVLLGQVQQTEPRERGF